MVGDGERGGGDGRRWVARLVVPTLDDSDVLGGADVARLPKRLRGMSHPAGTPSRPSVDIHASRPGRPKCAAA